MGNVPKKKTLRQCKTFLFYSDCVKVKGGLSGLRQILEPESPLKLMKNAFYFILKALFVLKIFKFLF